MTDDVVHNVVGDLMRFVFKIRSTERIDVNKSSVSLADVRRMMITTELGLALLKLQ